MFILKVFLICTYRMVQFFQLKVLIVVYRLVITTLLLFNPTLIASCFVKTKPSTRQHPRCFQIIFRFHSHYFPLEPFTPICSMDSIIVLIITIGDYLYEYLQITISTQYYKIVIISIYQHTYNVIFLPFVCMPSMHCLVDTLILLPKFLCAFLLNKQTL